MVEGLGFQFSVFSVQKNAAEEGVCHWVTLTDMLSIALTVRGLKSY